jgi:hypothetical protein
MNGAMASGAASGNFGAAFNLLNTMLILAFIPLMKTPIPLGLSEMMKGFLDFELIPNLFVYGLDEGEMTGTEPYKEAEDFGFETNVFIMNAGEQLS